MKHMIILFSFVHVLSAMPVEPSLSKGRDKIWFPGPCLGLLVESTRRFSDKSGPELNFPLALTE